MLPFLVATLFAAPHTAAPLVKIEEFFMST
jgi:hypothetical protein